MVGEWDDDEPIQPASGSPGSGMSFDDDFLRHAVAHNCLVDGDGRIRGQLDTHPRCREDLDVACDPQPD